MVREQTGECVSVDPPGRSMVPVSLIISLVVEAQLLLVRGTVECCL